MDNCNNSTRSVNRSAGASLPSVNAAAFNNPAAISLSRGVGIETILYGGEGQVGIVTGTGRVGAAISNFPNDGTFFGNTAIENIYSNRLRVYNRDRFKEDKFVLAGGFNLFGAKQRKGLQADIGLMYRRHKVTEENYYGGGITLSFNKIFSIGYATYSDIYYEDLRNKKMDYVEADGTVTENVIFPNELAYLFESKFSVVSYTAGVKFSKFAIDYIKFMTEFENFEERDKLAESSIYNISYFYTTWIFSYGRRFEKSYTEVYEDEKFRQGENKAATFLGAQYATESGFLLGIFHNYYLLDDLSLGLTYFF